MGAPAVTGPQDGRQPPDDARDGTAPSVTTSVLGDAFLLGLDRPSKLNALDERMVDEIHSALDEAAKRPCVLVVHSTTPGVFAAGADIAELRARTSNDALRAINAGLFARVAAHRWPSIAVIDGPAVGGGCELALACDLRWASTRASFAQPELSLGILAGAGANWRLPQIVGVAAARRMLYLGERLSAQEAAEAGLADAVRDPAELLESALEAAAAVASRSWLALDLTKTALAASARDTTALDVAGQAILFDSEDKRERMGRWLNRREPRRVVSP